MEIRGQTGRVSILEFGETGSENPNKVVDGKS